MSNPAMGGMPQMPAAGMGNMGFQGMTPNQGGAAPLTPPRQMALGGGAYGAFKSSGLPPVSTPPMIDGSANGAVGTTPPAGGFKGRGGAQVQPTNTTMTQNTDVSGFGTTGAPTLNVDPILPNETGGLPPKPPLPPLQEPEIPDETGGKWSGEGPPPWFNPNPVVDPPLTQETPPNVFEQSAGALTNAVNAAGQAANYTPNTPLLRDQNLSAYMNPYENQVVNMAMGDLDRARQMSLNKVGASAQSSGAFGGSRQGIMEAETNKAFANEAARTAARLRQQGYTGAQGMALQDIQNQIAGDQFGAGVGLKGADVLGQLSNLGFGQGQELVSGLERQGALQQLLNQQIIDAAQGQFADYQQHPANTIGLVSSALSATPNQSTTTTTRKPGLFDYLTLGATAMSGG